MCKEKVSKDLLLGTTVKNVPPFAQRLKKFNIFHLFLQKEERFSHFITYDVPIFLTKRPVRQSTLPRDDYTSDEASIFPKQSIAPQKWDQQGVLRCRNHLERQFHSVTLQSLSSVPNRVHIEASAQLSQA